MATAAVGIAAAIPFGYDPLPFDSDDFYDYPPTSLLVPSLANSMDDPSNHPMDISMAMIQGSLAHSSSSEEQLDGSPLSQTSSLGATAALSSFTVSSSDRVPPQRLDTRMIEQTFVVQNKDSISPGTASNSVILTPASTLFEYHSSGSDIADARDSWSPTSAAHDRYGGHGESLRPVYDAAAANGERLSALMASQPFRPPLTSTSSAPAPPDFPSRASPAASSSVAATTSLPCAWETFSDSTTGWMDPSSHRQGDDDPNMSHSYSFNDELFPGVTQASDDVLADQDYGQVGGGLPYHTIRQPTDVYSQTPYQHAGALYQQSPMGFADSQAPPAFWEHHRHHADQMPMHHLDIHHQSGSQAQRNYNFQMDSGFQLHPPIASESGQPLMNFPPTRPSQETTASSSNPQQTEKNISADRLSPYSQVSIKGVSEGESSTKVRQLQQTSARESPASAAGSKSSSRSTGKGKAPVSSRDARASKPDESRQPKVGGRRRGLRLTEEKREKSNKMRKQIACWRCAMQRDSCDFGQPCKRCLVREQKGQPYFFDCNREKLPAFMHDFVPHSMTWMHEKQTIEDTVSLQVLSWDRENPIEIGLTSGYGPPLRWKVYEFKPKDEEYLGQLQYFQDPSTGKSCRFHKYSPPFALMKIDASDDSHFSDYLDQLLLPEHLWEFGWTFFEEETQVDPDGFQAQTLQFLCELYTKTSDENLRSVLSQVLKMMIVTFIMGHTLTIEDSMLMEVLASVKGSPRPQQPSYYTSPRLANRQLKFFFNVLRSTIYEKLLHWQQQTLHTSGKRDTSWLPAFCAMLGFAMMLEEVQRLIMVQADSSIYKQERPIEEIKITTRSACERIDERFTLLVGLFQCKYRDKTWGANGSFGPGTPQLRDPVAHSELQQLHDLVVEKAAHLESRRDVEYAQENQCQYTSRLVARFLLPFLKLQS